MSDRPNIPLPDELADLRDQIAALEARKEVVRKALIADPTARTGKHYLVEVKDVTSQRLDLKPLREMYPEAVAEHTYPKTTTMVELKRITSDGEITSARRMKEQAA